MIGIDLDEDALNLARDNCEEFEVEVDLVRAEVSGRESHGESRSLAFLPLPFRAVMRQQAYPDVLFNLHRAALPSRIRRFED